MVPQKLPTHKPYVHQDFPTYRYHPDGRAMLVKTPDVLARLNKEWRDTPYPEIPKSADGAPQPDAPADVKKALKAQEGMFNKAYAKLEAELKNVSGQHAELLKAHAELEKAHAELLEQHSAVLASSQPDEPPPSDPAQ